MDVVEGVEKLVHDVAGFRLTDSTIYDFLEEFSALAQLHDHYVVGFLVVDFVEFCDVGVVQ